MSQLEQYYQERAAEYDAVYAKPERQSDLVRLRDLLPDLVRGRSVLELAAGTGYWTEVLSRTASSITATDVNEEPLRIARSRTFGPARVAVQLADAYRPDEVPGDFDTCFAGFFWSHVPRSRLRELCRGIHRRVGTGGRLIVLDNRFVEGSSTPVSRSDQGDTYQVRRLVDGREFEVLKNFPDQRQVVADVGEVATDVEWRELDYYWLAIVSLR